MRYKKWILSTGLSLAFLVPSTALAQGVVSQEGQVPGMAIFTSNKTMEEKEQKELSPEVKAKAKALKEKYKNAEISKEQFREQMRQILPEDYQCKHKDRPELTEEEKGKLKELKAKLKNGEITKEEFKTEMNTLKKTNK